MNLLDRNDRPGVHAPSWYADTANPFPELTPLSGPVRADVAIVGGGFTGLSSALHLAEQGASVVLIEAQRIGWGASGRNGGQVGVGQRRDQFELERMVGLERARAAWEIGRDAAKLVRRLIMRHGIHCGLRSGVLHVNHRKRYDDASEALAEHMALVYGHHDIDYVAPEQMHKHLNARGYSGGTLDRSAAHLHPLNFARGLGHAAMRAGARMHEMSRAIEVAPGLVRTENGEIHADQVILGCNGYLGGLAPKVSARVMPINNYIVATEPLRAADARALIPGGVAVADSRFVVNYFRLSQDNRLLFGGGESYGDAFPADIPAFVRPRMEAVFPQLRGVKITHGWGGTLAITMSRLPMFEEIAPGVLNASGYSGSGVALATMAGRLLAQAIKVDRTGFDAMADLPTPTFPGGAAMRKPTLVAAMLLARLRDAL
ncbi:MAG: gamma-glutamylputrescine oxidase [Paracoccaceae bacterium]|jgi:gamma-glutamylputrescine oxidase